ncbi:PKD domain-containing protein [Aquicoccus sp. G2-2]|uniref:PKD domain-containing protein n=1 Tax=Aquicoccus sp. G2-2 TaxID=3092120 RepID=UPI002ADFF526|nr:PKD domain-containing protein [Aquicoccus sp. G2-2]MEA1112961.1 PKD domain-containing protein [Aquicoccus sp. G2-2]
MRLDVRPVNDAPEMAPLGDVALTEGDTLRVQIVASDRDGDALSYSLLHGPAGATLSATGLLEWVAAGGKGSQGFAVGVSDGQGGFAQRSFDATVGDVPLAVTLTAPESAVMREDVGISFGILDSGSDTVAKLSVDWGDGTQEMLPTDQRAATHVYALPGAYLISVQVEDQNGVVATDSHAITIGTPGLKVTSVIAASWGISVRFSGPVDTGLPNPYRLLEDDGEPIDIALIDADGAALRGSLVPDADARGFAYLISGKGLSAGQYTLRLVGNLQGWRNDFDTLAADTGGVYERIIEVQAAPAQIHVEDAVARPGARLGPGGRGLEVSLTQAGGIRSMLLDLDWQVDTVSIDGLNTALEGVTVTREGGGPGHTRLRLHFATPPAAGALLLGYLEGAINAAVPYGKVASAVSLRILEINGEAVDLSGGDWAGDKALAIAAAPGDANADQTVSFADTSLFDALGRIDMGGVSAWRQIDIDLLRPTERPLPDDGGGGSNGNGGSNGGGWDFAAGTGVVGGGGGLAVRPVVEQTKPLSLADLDPLVVKASLGSSSGRLFHSGGGALVNVCMVAKPSGEGAADRAAEICFRTNSVDFLELGRKWKLDSAEPEEDGANAPRAATPYVDFDDADRSHFCVVQEMPESFEGNPLYEMMNGRFAVSKDKYAAPTKAMRLCFEAVADDFAQVEPSADAEAAALTHISVETAPVEDAAAAPLIPTVLAAATLFAVPRAPGADQNARRKPSDRFALLLDADHEPDPVHQEE